MLDLLRRHAESWVIKVVLIMIVLSFALFFGYSDYSGQLREAEVVVAKVEGVTIPRQRFNRLVEVQLNELRKKENSPVDLEPLLRQALLQQLISREVSFRFAVQQGIRAPDQAVARSIHLHPALSPNGFFEPQLYDIHRRAYEATYGEDYEEALRRELTLERLDELARICFAPWTEAMEHALPEPSDSQGITPEKILNRWIEKFREKADIEVYPNPS